MPITQAKYALIGENLEIIENVEIETDEFNRIVEINELKRNVKTNLICMPGLFNAHVHSADIGLRNHVKSGNLSELVGPNGIKINYLESLNENDLIKAIKLSQKEAYANGVLGWADFREGGLAGLSPYENQVKSPFIPFARVGLDQSFELPDYSHLGFRDVIAYPVSEMIQIAKNVRSQNKLIWIHGSEDIELRNRWIKEFESSDIQWAIHQLQVNCIVHLTHASLRDIELMKEKNVGGVLCISSNQFTGAGNPPIIDLIESNIKIGLGTDNAMFANLSLWNELHLLFKKNVNPKRILSMATIDGAQLVKLDWGVVKGNANFITIELPFKVKRKELYEKLVNISPNHNSIIKNFAQI